MQNIQFFSRHLVSDYQVKIVPDALNNKITIVAIALLACLAIVFIAFRNGFHSSVKKKDEDLKPSVSPLKVQLAQEEMKLSPKEEIKEAIQPKEIELKKVEPVVPEEDQDVKRLNSLGAREFLRAVSKDELKKIVLQWQKEDATILKLSELYKNALFSSDKTVLTSDLFKKLTDSIENSDLQKLIEKGGHELKMFCMAPMILKMLHTNTSVQDKETQILEIFFRQFVIADRVFDIGSYASYSEEFHTLCERAKSFREEFCEYLAEKCPTAEIETLGKAYSKYGCSNAMRQLLYLYLITQTLLSKDPSRINATLSVYWNHREIIDFGVPNRKACKQAIINLTQSEEVLKAVYSAISDDKDEMKEVLQQVELPKDVLDRVLI